LDADDAMLRGDVFQNVQMNNKQPAAALARSHLANAPLDERTTAPGVVTMGPLDDDVEDEEDKAELDGGGGEANDDGGSGFDANTDGTRTRGWLKAEAPPPDGMLTNCGGGGGDVPPTPPFAAAAAAGVPNAPNACMCDAPSVGLGVRAPPPTGVLDIDTP